MKIYKKFRDSIKIPMDINWLTIIVTAIFVALGEFLFSKAYQNKETLFYSGFLLEISRFCLYVLLWILPLWVYSLAIKIIEGFKKIKFFFNVFLVVIFALYLVSIFCGWYFYFKTGYFLDRELILFGLQNFLQVQFHLLQTTFLSILLLDFTAIILSIILNFVLRKNFKLSFKNKGSFQKIFIIFISLFSFLFLCKTNCENLAHRTHPFLAYIMPLELEKPSLKDCNVINPYVIYPPKEFPKYSEYKVSNPIIVILIESLRRDLIFKEPSPMPFMRSLIKEGLFFDKAYATSTSSDYNDLSIWYSQYPLRTFYNHQAYNYKDPWRGVSIFKIFKELGYKTAYIASQNEKWGNMIQWLRLPEIDYFFHSEDYVGETWDNKDDFGGLHKLIEAKITTAGKIEDSITLNIAKDWIKTLEKKDKFFLGMNLQNTHYNYVVPKGGEEPFQPSIIDFPAIYAFWPKEKVENVRNRYFNAVYNVDRMVYDFINFLKDQSIWENCIFVILGDNGEAFYEHGIGNHTGVMYDEAVRTFCFIKVPRGLEPRVVEEPISHIDIFPTILDLLNVPSPASFQGVSVFENRKRKAVYMHSNTFVRQNGIVQWPWKLLITSRPLKKVELYNLEEDKFEEKNLYGEAVYDIKVRELSKKLDEWKNSQLRYYRRDRKPFYLMFSPPRYID